MKKWGQFCQIIFGEVTIKTETFFVENVGAILLPNDILRGCMNILIT